MRGPFTKDLLAVLLTAVFLAWVVASSFAPMFLHLYLSSFQLESLAALDGVVGMFLLFAYLTLARRFPDRARTPAS